jgi:hypothetical protein
MKRLLCGEGERKRSCKAGRSDGGVAAELDFSVGGSLSLSVAREGRSSARSHKSRFSDDR